MFVVTFYSYKGGVGRTMALANVAYLLAARGKKVLVVDFDLEAPSLPNYGSLSSAKPKLGIVDYVTEYRKTGIAPDASDFITKCEANNTVIHLMAAGDTSTVEYSQKLSSIDWNALYDEEKGYLFFEDLKQQWQNYNTEGFDYVLIDSRTGHTDVGGICTRQLPDLVVPMFIPTMQNISGLQPIVDEIRVEPSRANDPVRLTFCASNVPDLDDEKEILSELLGEASVRLGYDPISLNVVHHYRSLNLLSHSIFVADRPNSRLAKEYEELTKTIIAHNEEDAEGAKIALRRYLSEIESSPRNRQSQVRSEVIEKVNRIYSLHPADSDLALLVSRLRSRIGDLEGEIDALTSAIESGERSTRLLRLRARAFQVINMTERSVSDLREILRKPDAPGEDVTFALRMLARVGNDFDDEIEQLLSREDLTLEVLNSIAEVAQRNRDHLSNFALRVQSLLASESLENPEVEFARNNLLLALIGTGRFSEAIAMVEPLTLQPEESLSLQFNLFVARWGLRGQPSRRAALDLAHTFRELKPRRDANFLQCRALIEAILLEKGSALECLDRADEIMRVQGGRAFSCMTYLFQDEECFLHDNAKLRQMILKGEVPSLTVFETARQQ